MAGFGGEFVAVAQVFQRLRLRVDRRVGAGGGSASVLSAGLLSGVSSDAVFGSASPADEGGPGGESSDV